MLPKTPLELAKTLRSTNPTLDRKRVVQRKRMATPKSPLIENKTEARKTTQPQLTRTQTSKISTQQGEVPIAKKLQPVPPAPKLHITRREVQRRLAKTLRSTNPTLKQN